MVVEDRGGRGIFWWKFFVNSERLCKGRGFLLGEEIIEGGDRKWRYGM